MEQFDLPLLFASHGFNVAGDQVFVSEVPEPFRFPALVPILGVVAGDEVPQVVDFERLGLEGAVLVGARVAVTHPIVPQGVAEAPDFLDQGAAVHTFNDLAIASISR